MPEPQPLLELSHRADLGILFGRWSRQPTPAELPAAYEALAAATLQAACGCWLQDIRRRTHNDPATTDWLLAEYFPGLARRLQQRLCVAYLVGPALHETVLATSRFRDLAAYAHEPFAVRLFGDEGAAVAWLQAEQARTGGPTP